MGADTTQKTVRVLVVDDEPLYAKAISAVLEQSEGVEVVGWAGDGYDAIQQAEALRPDVVLMDIKMPRLDGLAATRRIRRSLPRTQVVMLTAIPGDEDFERARGAGAAGYVRKSGPPAELLAVMQEVAWEAQGSLGVASEAQGSLSAASA